MTGRLTDRELRQLVRDMLDATEPLPPDADRIIDEAFTAWQPAGGQGEADERDKADPDQATVAAEHDVRRAGVELLGTLDDWQPDLGEVALASELVRMTVDAAPEVAGRWTVLVSANGVALAPHDVYLTDADGVDRVGAATPDGALRFEQVADGVVRFVKVDVRGSRREPRRSFRLDRTMAAAAGVGGRLLAGRYESTDGDLVTDVVENGEAHLIVTVSATSGDPATTFAVVRWTLVGPAGVLPVRLVTPLAQRSDGTLTVAYDAGSVAGAEAVEVEPAEIVDAATVAVEDVRVAFALGQRGTARRAWQAALEGGQLDPEVVEAIREALRGA